MVSKYNDNVDGDNDLCDKVISNIFYHQLLKECGITRHSDAKINLAIECRSYSFTEYLFYLFYAVQDWVSPDELAFL